MSLRRLAMPLPALLLPLALLLAACSSQPEKSQPAPAKPKRPSAEQAIAAPLPGHLRQLSGSLLGIPADAEAEIALLQVDAKGRPLKSYASQRLQDQGGALPFALSFDPQSLTGDGRFELRARVGQSGRLILRLPPQALNPTQSRDFGPLQLVRAP